MTELRFKWCQCTNTKKVRNNWEKGAESLRGENKCERKQRDTERRGSWGREDRGERERERKRERVCGTSQNQLNIQSLYITDLQRVLGYNKISTS